jgi:hypothetical protein
MECGFHIISSSISVSTISQIAVFLHTINGFFILESKEFSPNPFFFPEF